MGGGEGDAAEHFAGVFGAAGVVAAFLGGHGVFHHRHHQLGVPFQTDDGKLAQGHEQTAAITVNHQLLLEELADAVGDLGGVLAVAVADLLDPGAEHHGIQYLHHSGGTVGAGQGQTVGAAQTGVAAENVGVAVLAAEDGPFGEHGHTVQCCRPGGSYGGIGQDSVEEGHVDAVMVPVKGHRLHINVGVDQIGAADPGVGGGVQDTLGAFGQIDPQVLDAVLIPTAVGDLPGVNGNGLLQILGSAVQRLLTMFGHGDTSRKEIGDA